LLSSQEIAIANLTQNNKEQIDKLRANIIDMIKDNVDILRTNNAYIEIEIKNTLFIDFVSDDNTIKNNDVLYGLYKTINSKSIDELFELLKYTIRLDNVNDDMEEFRLKFEKQDLEIDKLKLIKYLICTQKGKGIEDANQIIADLQKKVNDSEYYKARVSTLNGEISILEENQIENMEENKSSIIINVYDNLIENALLKGEITFLKEQLTDKNQSLELEELNIKLEKLEKLEKTYLNNFVTKYNTILGDNEPELVLSEFPLKDMSEMFAKMKVDITEYKFANKSLADMVTNMSEKINIINDDTCDLPPINLKKDIEECQAKLNVCENELEKFKTERNAKNTKNAKNVKNAQNAKNKKDPIIDFFNFVFEDNNNNNNNNNIETTKNQITAINDIIKLEKDWESKINDKSLTFNENTNTNTTRKFEYNIGEKEFTQFDDFLRIGLHLIINFELIISKQVVNVGTINNSGAISVYDDVLFKQLNQKIMNAILDMPLFVKLVAHLYGYLTNPFQVMIGVKNNVNTGVEINKDLVCTEECIKKNLKINKTSYDYFDNFYLPQTGAHQYFTNNDNNNDNIKTSLHEVSEIDALIKLFSSAGKEEKNYILMHYGYSGTGKTVVADKIIEKLNKSEAKLVETRYTYGMKGILEGATYIFNDDFTSDTKVINHRKEFTSDTKLINHKTELTELTEFDSDLKYKILYGNKLFKETLNNKQSSRFHKCYIFEKGNNKLFFFDLAGSENQSQIISSGLTLEEKREYIVKKGVYGKDNKIIKLYNFIVGKEKDKNLIYTKKSIYLEINRLSGYNELELTLRKIIDSKTDSKTDSKILVTSLIGALQSTYDTEVKEEISKAVKKIDIEQIINNDFDKFKGSLYKILYPPEKSKNKVVDGGILLESLLYKYISKKSEGLSKKDRLHILLESYFITDSLKNLQRNLINFRSNPTKPISIKNIGLTENTTKFEKIVMFGFIRTENSFDEGTTATLDFLNTIASPTTQPGGNLLLSNNNGKVLQTGGTNYDINYDTFQDSHVSVDTISFLQQMVFMYTMKILRWSFYYKQMKTEAFYNSTKNENNGRLYSNILIDYIVSMMVSLFVYATNNNTLFYGFLFDEIMSILMLLKTNNEEVLLVPYFLVIYGIDLLK
jgi:hypothetical protein